MIMSLENWLKEGRLKGHKTSAREVAELLKLVDWDLADSAIQELSADRRFATAYNAALQLAPSPFMPRAIAPPNLDIIG
jgi:hypothetical protein